MVVRSKTFTAIPPGASIRDQLENRAMSQKELAARMGMSEKHISKLINGEVQLTADVAVRLETVLGVPAQFWTSLEAVYRETLIKAEAENSMEADEKIARMFPYAAMAKFGWVEPTRNVKEKVNNLRRFFEVVQLGFLDNELITKVACRRLIISEKSDLAVIAWAQQAKICAREVETEPFNMSTLQKSVDQIRASVEQNDYKTVKKILSESGIALVLLPHLESAFLEGATFRDGKKIVIGITERKQAPEKMSFSLFHELGHVVLEHLDRTSSASLTDEDEKKADEWARQILCP